MGDRRSRADLRKLERWQRRMITAFVGTWSFVLLFIAGELVFDLSRAVVIAGFVVMLILVAFGAVIQFSQRCPSCGARIGVQSGLRLPDSCRKCGAAFKVRDRDAEG